MRSVLLLLLTLYAHSQSIVFEDILEKKITTSGVAYIIKAQERVIYNSSPIKFLFGKHRYMSKNLYYKNGSFMKKDILINFKKAYWLEGKFYMKDCSGLFDEYHFKSKETIYSAAKLAFKKILYNHENQYYSNYIYYYNFNKN